MSSINDKLIQLGETKNLIKNAIIGKGVEITPDTPFRDYASKISEIGGNMIVMTQETYDALPEKDPNTLYVIVSEV